MPDVTTVGPLKPDTYNPDDESFCPLFIEASSVTHLPELAAVPLVPDPDVLFAEMLGPLDTHTYNLDDGAYPSLFSGDFSSTHLPGLAVPLPDDPDLVSMENPMPNPLDPDAHNLNQDGTISPSFWQATPWVGPSTLANTLPYADPYI